MKTIIVLPDGETWNLVDGVSMMVLNDDDFNDLAEDRVRMRDIVPLVEIQMKDWSIGC